MYQKTFIGGVLLCTTLVILLNCPLMSIEISELVQQAEEKFGTINDIIIEQEMTALEGGEEVTFDLVIMIEGDKYRIEMYFPDDKLPPQMKGQKVAVISLYDGEEYWVKSPFEGKSKQDEEKKEQYVMLTAYMNWWKMASGEAPEVTGTEAIDGRECYVIEMEDEGKLWVDKNASVIVKAETTNDEGKSEGIICSDFKTVGEEWELPHLMEVKEDGELELKLIINSFKINEGISDDFFDPEKL
jgi:outer membrane lipoprotein-sorting protein